MWVYCLLPVQLPVAQGSFTRKPSSIVRQVIASSTRSGVHQLNPTPA
jgi:hypothetical protein